MFFASLLLWQIALTGSVFKGKFCAIEKTQKWPLWVSFFTKSHKECVFPVPHSPSNKRQLFEIIRETLSVETKATIAVYAKKPIMEVALEGKKSELQKALRTIGIL